MAKSKARIFYDVRTYEQHGHMYTEVTIYEGTSDRETLLTDSIAGCVDNKAGYGTPETAPRMAARFTALQNAGYVSTFDTMYAPLVRCTWLHASKGDDTGYCEGKVTFHEDFSRVESCVKLWATIRRAMVFAFQPSEYIAGRSPQLLLNTLSRRKAIRMYDVTVKVVGDYDWFCYAMRAPGTQDLAPSYKRIVTVERTPGSPEYTIA